MSTSTKAPGARDAALKLLKAGYWPVVVYPPGIERPSGTTTGKESMGRAWGLERITPDQIRRRFHSWPRAGVGVCLGPGRAPNGDWLIDLEGDGSEAETSRLKLFAGEEVETIGWGSTRGGHGLYTADAGRLLPILARIKGCEVKRAGQPGVYHLDELPGLEIRVGGYKDDRTIKQLQSVVPPTPGTDGQPRRWNGCKTLAALPEAAYVVLETIAARIEPQARASGQANGDGHAAPRERRAETAADGRRTWFLAKLKGLAGNLVGVGEGSRHSTLLAIARTLGGYLANPIIQRHGYLVESEVIAELLTASRLTNPPMGEAEARETIADGIAHGKAHPCDWPRDLDPPGTNHNGRHKPGANGQPPSRDERPVIVITEEEHLVNDQAVEAIACDPNLYVRGGALVTITRDHTQPGKVTVERPDGTPRLALLPAARLRELMTTHARWKKRQKGDKEPKLAPAHPPDWSVKAVMARGEWKKIRPIIGIVEAPTLRPDGSIIDRPGYDPSTGLLYAPNGTFPAIPQEPGQDEARAAAKRLLDLVGEFPFAGEPHKAAWLAAVLTLLARYAIDGPCPLTLFDANVPAAGKSKLCDLVSIIAFDRPMTRTAFPESDDEMRKRIMAIALAADPAVMIDNIATTFGGSALDAALTATTWTDRILGRTEMAPALPLYTVWFATGNNVNLRGDVVRRIIPSRLQSNMERPEERSGFQHADILGHAHQKRGEFIRDALTILKAHAAAGRPVDSALTPMDYPAWCKVVRAAVHWSTGIDPAGGRKDLRDSDPETASRLALVAGWAELPEGQGKGHTVTEAIEMVKVTKDQPIDHYPILRGVLLDWSRTSELPSARSVGMRLNALRDRVIGGKRFEAVPIGGGRQAWRVVPVEGWTSGTSWTNPNPSREKSRDPSPENKSEGAGNSPTSSTSPTPASAPPRVEVDPDCANINFGEPPPTGRRRRVVL